MPRPGRDERHIFVVDDDPAHLKAITLLLDAEGYRVLPFSGGAQALEQLDNGARPALIISDVMMPGISGRDLRRKILEREDLATIPFLFLTAADSLDDKIRGYLAEVDGYLTKPYSRAELAGAVAGLLNLRHRRARQAEQQKLDAIKLIAVRMSHEINTALAVIVGSLQLLKNEKSKPGAQAGELIEQSLNAAGDIGDIVEKLHLIRRVAAEPYVGDALMLDIDGAIAEDAPVDKPGS